MDDPPVFVVMRISPNSIKRRSLLVFSTTISTDKLDGFIATTSIHTAMPSDCHTSPGCRTEPGTVVGIGVGVGVGVLVCVGVLVAVGVGDGPGVFVGVRVAVAVTTLSLITSVT